MMKRTSSEVRPKRRAPHLRAIAGIATILLSAACGGGNVASSGGATPVKVSLNGTPMPEYTPPVKGTLALIKERGKIINGMEAQNPPFESMQNGKIVGYDADLMAMLGKKLGVEVENVDTAWAGVIPSLYAQKFDLIWSAMTMTKPRREAVGFSAAYASDQAVVLVTQGNTSIKSIGDLAGKTIGTQLNSAAELQIKQLATDQKISYKELKSYDHFQDAYLDLKNGNVDAVTGTKLNNITLFKNDPNSLRVGLELPYYNYVGVATRKGDAELLAAVNNLISEMKASGELAALQKKWFGFEMDLVEK